MGGDRKENFRYQPLYKKYASQRRHHDLFCKKNLLSGFSIPPPLKTKNLGIFCSCDLLMEKG